MAHIGQTLLHPSLPGRLLSPTQPTAHQTDPYKSHPNPWAPRFEDRDFLGELRKPEGERKIKCEPLLRDEAVEVWKQYAQRPDNVHY